MTTSSMSTSTVPGPTDPTATTTNDQGSTTDQAKHAASVASDEAKQVASDVRDQARGLLDETKNQVEDQSRTQRDRLVETCAPSATTSTAWPSSAAAWRPTRRVRWPAGCATIRAAAGRPGADRAPGRPAVLRPTPSRHVPRRVGHRGRRGRSLPARRPRGGPDRQPTGSTTTSPAQPAAGRRRGDPGEPLARRTSHDDGRSADRPAHLAPASPAVTSGELGATRSGPRDDGLRRAPGRPAGGTAGRPQPGPDRR